MTCRRRTRAGITLFLLASWGCQWLFLHRHSNNDNSDIIEKGSPLRKFYDRDDEENRRVSSSSSRPSRRRPLSLGRPPIRSSRGKIATQKKTATNSKIYDICFVISVYGNSVETVDRVSEVFALFGSRFHKFGFFAFTNLHDLPLPEPWRRMVLSPEDYGGPYRRWITHSRFAKFMAWKLDAIQQDCATVVYFDAWKTLRYHPRLWNRLADELLGSQNITSSSMHATMALRQNDKGTQTLEDQWRGILDYQKDLPAHVQITKSWIEEQSDYDPDLTLYTNTQFMYVPTCPHWQRATMTFWNRYSLELGSWRDQPLWAYTLHHLHLRPALPLGDVKQLWDETWDNRQQNPHVYDERDDENAVSTPTNSSVVPS